MYNRISLAALTLALAAGPAFSHATLESSEAAAGAGYKAVIRIGHGCDGHATKTLRVQIPDGFYNAKPMPKAGWTLETVTGDYAQPFDNHGTPMASGVREIVWTGELPDAWYDEFVFRGTVGPEVAPGSKLYFPTTQECGDDLRAVWTDVSGAADSKTPAPALTVTEKAAGQHAAPAAAPLEMLPPVQVGDLSISSAWSRATLPGAPAAGGFMTLTNAGSADDRLVSGSTPVAARVEIHEMTMDGDVMKMRLMADGMPIPAGGAVELKPGSYHLMFMELAQPLVEGETVPLTLEFEKAGKVDVMLKVGPPKTQQAEHGSKH